MIRKHIHLLFICWLAYAVVPVINYIGVFNGVYVMLCATKGVMIHDASAPLSSIHTLDHSDPHAHHQVSHQPIDHQKIDHHAHHMSLNDTNSAEPSAEDHEAERCPCIHFSFDTALAFHSDTEFEKSLQSIADNNHVSPIAAIYAAQARGPPRLHKVFHETFHKTLNKTKQHT